MHTTGCAGHPNHTVEKSDKEWVILMLGLARSLLNKECGVLGLSLESFLFNRYRAFRRWRFLFNRGQRCEINVVCCMLLDVYLGQSWCHLGGILGRLRGYLGLPWGHIGLCRGNLGTTAPERTDAPSAHLGAQKRPLRTYAYI